jgi:hypothetical protein
MAGKQQLDDLEAVRKVIDALTEFDTGDRERVLRWAREKLGLAAEAPPGRAGSAGTVVVSAPVPLAPIRGGTDIKSFIESKSPGSDTQFAAAVAFFYRFEAPEHLRKESITKDDLQEACRLVERSRFHRPSQTLVNAHTQGLLDRGDRGAYSISTVGENLVAVALPSDGGRAVLRKKTSAKRATAKRKPAAKAAAKSARAKKKSAPTKKKPARSKKGKR